MQKANALKLADESLMEGMEGIIHTFPQASKRCWRKILQQGLY